MLGRSLRANISISTNLKICNFLDVTLNLTGGNYYPYRQKPYLPAAIGRRISDISSSKELFNKAKPHHKSALKQSGHDEKFMYTERKKPVAHTAQNSRKKRQRKIIWFNPPFSMNVQTNIGREFLSRHIWTLKDNNTNFTTNWSILATTQAYNNKSKRCHRKTLLNWSQETVLIKQNKPFILTKA